MRGQNPIRKFEAQPRSFQFTGGQEKPHLSFQTTDPDLLRRLFKVEPLCDSAARVSDREVEAWRTAFLS